MALVPKTAAQCLLSGTGRTGAPTVPLPDGVAGGGLAVLQGATADPWVPRAIFRLRVILSHLGAALELLPGPAPELQDASGAALMLMPGPGASELALLPWPLTDTLGKDLRRLLRGAATAGARAPGLPQGPGRPALAALGAERWWPAM